MLDLLAFVFILTASVTPPGIEEPVTVEVREFATQLGCEMAKVEMQSTYGYDPASEGFKLHSINCLGSVKERSATPTQYPRFLVTR